MQELNYKIVTFTDTCFFIYNRENIVIQVPTVIDSNSTSTTAYNPTTDTVIEKPTIEELMVEFDALGLTMPEDNSAIVSAPVWIHEDKPLRVFLSDSDYVALLIDYPQFAMIRFERKIPVELQNGCNYLYLEYIIEEDRALFEYFGGKNCIEIYSPQP